MVKVIDQDIPSEDLYKYQGSLQEATVRIDRRYGSHRYGWGCYGSTPSPAIVRKRIPFRIGHQQTKSPHSPSPAQKAVRKKFRRACSCFQAQREFGGVMPGQKGPRNKSWWYEEAQSTGLYYYNYFMQQTLDYMFGPDAVDEYPFPEKRIPEWCQMTNLVDCMVGSFNPDYNFGGQDVSMAGVMDVPTVRRHFIRTVDYVEASFSVWISIIVAVNDTDESMREIGCYRVYDRDWDEYTLTWNNQPERYRLLDRKVITEDGWVEFEVKNANSICLAMLDESIPNTGRMYVSIRTMDHLAAGTHPIIEN